MSKKNKDWGYNPVIEAMAKAIYDRMNTHKERKPWKDADLDVTDHYYIAAQNALRAMFLRLLR